jgi:hypothetical protein
LRKYSDRSLSVRVGTTDDGGASDSRNARFHSFPAITENSVVKQQPPIWRQQSFTKPNMRYMQVILPLADKWHPFLAKMLEIIMAMAPDSRNDGNHIVSRPYDTRLSFFRIDHFAILSFVSGEVAISRLERNAPSETTST